MDKRLRSDAEYIVRKAINASMPDEAVISALKEKHFPGRVILISIGKAAWQMANAALSCLEVPPVKGVVVTKYGHSKGSLREIDIYEAAHPVPDENGIIGCEAAIRAVSGLNESDTVLLLLSGGGSALFEKPLVPLDVLQDITDQLLRRAADISEINTIRKRLSAVKGGRFAELCRPAHVLTLILSDVLGDEPSAIASGPSVADVTTAEGAIKIAEKYSLDISDEVRELLKRETPKTLDNSEAVIIGSVRLLCRAAEKAAEELGYKTVLLTDCVTCEARDAGKMLAEKLTQPHEVSTAYIMGGETVVHVTGHGKGGRNQEIALSAAKYLDGISDVCVISAGSDGTDGPTDAAGGYVDGDTMKALSACCTDYDAVMENNDAYNALKAVDGLLITGPTGTNVNDVSVALIRV